MLYHGIISDRTRPVEEWLTGIESVTKEEIVKVAKNIELDTIYFYKERRESKWRKLFMSN